MTPQELKEQLFEGLNNTTQEFVAVNVAHVISIIGLERTQELLLWCIDVRTTVNLKKKVLRKLPIHKRYIREGYAGFRRLELIEALHATTRSSNRGTTDNSFEASIRETNYDNTRSTEAVDTSTG